MNDSFLLLMNPNFAPYWGGQGPPLVPFFVAPMLEDVGKNAPLAYGLGYI